MWTEFQDIPRDVMTNIIGYTVGGEDSIDVSEYKRLLAVNRQLNEATKQFTKHITSPTLTTISLELLVGLSNLETVSDNVLVKVTPSRMGPDGVLHIQYLLSSFPKLTHVNFYIDPINLVEEQGYFGGFFSTIQYYTGYYRPTDKYYFTIREIIGEFKDRPGTIRILWERPQHKSGIILSRKHFMYMGVNKTDKIEEMTNDLMASFSDLIWVSSDSSLAQKLKQKYGQRVRGAFSYGQLLMNENGKAVLMDLAQKRTIQLRARYADFANLPAMAKMSIKLLGIDENALRKLPSNPDENKLYSTEVLDYFAAVGIYELRLSAYAQILGADDSFSQNITSGLAIIVDFDNLQLYQIPEIDVDIDTYNYYYSALILSFLTGNYLIV